MQKEIIYLDLNRVTLIGFQRNVSDLRIEVLVNGIEAGNDIPPVRVYRINESLYQLTMLNRSDCGCGKDGGHHRAVAHYILNKPLKCIIEDELLEICFPPSREPINIKDIIIADDAIAVSKTYLQIKSVDPNYR